MMLRRALTRGQQGMCIAEYALGTVSACGFACVLLQLLPHWRSMLTEILIKGLTSRFGWPFTSFPW